MVGRGSLSTHFVKQLTATMQNLNCLEAKGIGPMRPRPHGAKGMRYVVALLNYCDGIPLHGYAIVPIFKDFVSQGTGSYVGLVGSLVDFFQHFCALGWSQASQDGNEEVTTPQFPIKKREAGSMDASFVMFLAHCDRCAVAVLQYGIALVERPWRSRGEATDPRMDMLDRGDASILHVACLLSLERSFSLTFSQ